MEICNAFEVLKGLRDFRNRALSANNKVQTRINVRRCTRLCSHVIEPRPVHSFRASFHVQDAVNLISVLITPDFVSIINAFLITPLGNELRAATARSERTCWNEKMLSSAIMKAAPPTEKHSQSLCHLFNRMNIIWINLHTLLRTRTWNHAPRESHVENPDARANHEQRELRRWVRKVASRFAGP